MASWSSLEISSRDLWVAATPRGALIAVLVVWRTPRHDAAVERSKMQALWTSRRRWLVERVAVAESVATQSELPHARPEPI